MLDVKTERSGVPRKVVLAAAFGVPAGLLIFGGHASQLAWMAALIGMTALYRADLREVGTDPASRLAVTEEWCGRLVLFAGWLALLLAYQGVQGAEEARPAAGVGHGVRG